MYKESNILSRRYAGRFALSAFTLIELLTVIAIIGILTAIIIPVVGQARKTSKNARCVSNLRQIVIATVAYGNDHKGKPPYTSGSASAPLYDLSPHSMTVAAYDDCLKPYLGDRFQAMYCPGEVSGGDLYNPDYQRVNNPNPYPAYFSYQYFNRTDVASVLYKTVFQNLNTAPANWAIWGDLAYLNNGIAIGHNENRVQATSLRGMNAAYVDGSVRWVPFSKMSQFAAGFYWPRPPGI